MVAMIPPNPHFPGPGWVGPLPLLSPGRALRICWRGLSFLRFLGRVGG